MLTINLPDNEYTNAFTSKIIYVTSLYNLPWQIKNHMIHLFTGSICYNEDMIMYKEILQLLSFVKFRTLLWW